MNVRITVGEEYDIFIEKNNSLKCIMMKLTKLCKEWKGVPLGPW